MLFENTETFVGLGLGLLIIYLFFIGLLEYLMIGLCSSLYAKIEKNKKANKKRGKIPRFIF